MKTTKALEINGQIWTVAKIKETIQNSDKAVTTCLVKIYEYQTEQEKNCTTTLDHNGVGFSGCDGQILSSICQFFLSKGYITPKQLELSRKKCLKYATQYFKILERRYPDAVKRVALEQ